VVAAPEPERLRLFYFAVSSLVVRFPGEWFNAEALDEAISLPLAHEGESLLLIGQASGAGRE